MCLPVEVTALDQPFFQAWEMAADELASWPTLIRRTEECGKGIFLLEGVSDSSRTTHAAEEAVDACRYLAGLIVPGRSR